jgi:hypothetical protein
MFKNEIETFRVEYLLFLTPEEHFPPPNSSHTHEGFLRICIVNGLKEIVSQD